MDFVHLIWSALSDPVIVAAAYVGGILIVGDVATGSFKAIRIGAFQWIWLSAFVKSKIAGQYLPLLVVYVVAKATPDVALPTGTDLNPLALLASTGFAAFIASEIASIKSNFDGSIDTPPQGVSNAAVGTVAVVGETTAEPQG